MINTTMHTIALSALLALAPTRALAQDTTLHSILREFFNFLLILPPFLLSIALLIFVWGMAVFILAAGDDKGRERGRKLMVWGVVALFILVSLWGIVAILINIFGLNAGATCPPPQIGNLAVTTC
jgi:hypothetical protein